MFYNFSLIQSFITCNFSFIMQGKEYLPNLRFGVKFQVVSDEGKIEAEMTEAVMNEQMNHPNYRQNRYGNQTNLMIIRGTFIKSEVKAALAF